MVKIQRKKGFTLAEVLITLGIIGVVAVMTIPTLMQKTNDRETISKLKKHYSEISQAYEQLVAEYGTPDGWYGNNTYDVSAEASIILGDKFEEKLKFLKACKQESGCFPNVTYKKIDGNNSIINVENLTNVSKYILADGASIYFYSYGSTPENIGNGFNDTQYGSIILDINGEKNPNTFGKDAFAFRINKRGIAPMGGSNENEPLNSFEQACNRNSCAHICAGCAAWVIFNDNMDYLHCDGLSWGGNTKCN